MSVELKMTAKKAVRAVTEILRRSTADKDQIAKNVGLTKYEIYDLIEYMEGCGFFDETKKIRQLIQKDELAYFIAISELLKKGSTIRGVAKETGLELGVVASIRDNVKMSGLQGQFNTTRRKRKVDTVTTMQCVGLALQGMSAEDISKKLLWSLSSVKAVLTDARKHGVIQENNPRQKAIRRAKDAANKKARLGEQ